MTAAATSCGHCGLALGPWPHRRDVNGETRLFCCYGCFIGWQVKRGGGDESAAAGHLVRLGVGAFLAMNIMLFSLAIYAGGFSAADGRLLVMIHVLLAVLSTPVLVILGGPFIVEALSELARGRISGSFLIALGATAAYGYSIVATFSGGDMVYFDIAAMVLVLVTVGRFLEADGRARAARNLAPLLQPHSQEVSIIDGDNETRLWLQDVHAGALVRIRPGERIVVDAVVVEGAGHVNESWLTGEGRPVRKTPGRHVLAGTVNLDGVLVVRCTVDGMATRWVDICRSVREDLTRRVAIQRITDRCAAVFVPVVIAVAVATVWFWARLLPLDQALMHGLAVLVVACPCALGLAAPLVTAMGLGRLAADGCLVRGGDVLLALAAIRKVAFDKTGTLTEGAVRLIGVSCLGASGDQVLQRAAALGRHSSHPLARGVVAFAEASGVRPLIAAAVRAVPGSGVIGCVDGDEAAVGAERWFVAAHWQLPEELVEALARVERRGRTAVYVGWSGKVYGVMAFDDAVRDCAPAAVSALRRLGVDSTILSGDAPGPTGWIAKDVGIDEWHASLLPAEKRDRIRDMKAKGQRVAMVGDGINDGPALTAADVGIAVGSSIDLARETAGVVLPKCGLGALPGVLALARRVKRTVIVNLAWAFAYNAVAVGLAATGMLRPILAAALMAGSSVIVIANSLCIGTMPIHSDQGSGIETERSASAPPLDNDSGLPDPLAPPFLTR